mmetsp:Transcript_39323/g.91933  ORF Transcript_39323/g.91933 Transcript_39323/m.91933 type:complete len:225 (-) Transcript_39323:629-1303(-)
MRAVRDTTLSSPNPLKRPWTVAARREPCTGALSSSQRRLSPSSSVGTPPGGALLRHASSSILTAIYSPSGSCAVSSYPHCRCLKSLGGRQRTSLTLWRWMTTSPPQAAPLFCSPRPSPLPWALVPPIPNTLTTSIWGGTPPAPPRGSRVLSRSSQEARPRAPPGGGTGGRWCRDSQPPLWKGLRTRGLSRECATASAKTTGSTGTRGQRATRTGSQACQSPLPP